MKFLIFQHARVEHPAIFREFFAADGIEWHAIELDEGEPIPSLDGFDALMAFGGPMDVWMSARIRGSSLKRPLSGHGCANDESRISASVLDINCWRTPSVEQSARWMFQKLASVKSHSAGLVRPPRFSATCRRSSRCSNGTEPQWNECRMAAWSSRAMLTARSNLSRSRTSLMACSIIWSQRSARSRSGVRFRNIVNRSSGSPDQMVHGAWNSKRLSAWTTFGTTPRSYIEIS
jgi:hypothetical protein